VPLMCWKPRIAVLLGAAVFAAAQPLCHSIGAQSAIVTGSVVDTTGAAVLGAEVSITGVPYRSVTDEKGNFSFSGVPAGKGSVAARRLGFLPTTLDITIVEGLVPSRLTLRMVPVPTILSPVLVQTRKVDYTGRLAGYYQRLEKRNSGYFITREQIDRENPRMLTQLLQHVPGISPVRGRFGSTAIRMRGRNCAPLVWIDGTPMPAGEVDLDNFSPQTLHGIEMYLGSTTAPARYTLNRDRNSCGTIILWSRGPDTDPIISSHRPAKDIERMVSAYAVYTAAQVDTQASLVRSPLHVVYPAGLFAEGVGGSVIAEFVVDRDGRMEPDTYGVVSSSNALFTEAVREALAGAVFTPAKLKGVPVRQLVHQPFTFVAKPPKGGT
jgi:TonB family protein